MPDILRITPREGYFGVSRSAPGSSHGPHMKQGIQFLAMLSGSLEMEVAGETRHLLPGNMALLLPQRAVNFRFDAQQESRHSWCQLDFDEIPPGLHRYLNSLAPQLPVDPQMEEMMELGVSITGSRHINNHRVLIELAQTLLHYYSALGALEEDARPRAMPRGLRQACRYISTHYQQPLALEDIAQHAHCSVNHLINLFKHYLNTTPARYLRQVRINQSEVLLKHTQQSVNKIAEQCGFISPFHFSRVFKAAHALSPRQFRDRFRG